MVDVTPSSLQTESQRITHRENQAAPGSLIPAPASGLHRQVDIWGLHLKVLSTMGYSLNDVLVLARCSLQQEKHDRRILSLSSARVTLVS